jgi:uncharacterized protein (DUF1499 family)
MTRLLILYCLVLLMTACGSVRQPHFGVREGQLASCDEVRGCVSSRASDPNQRLQAFSYSTSRQEAKGILLTVLNDTTGVSVVSNHRNYIRVEMRQQASEDFPGASAVIDDVEFYLDPVAQVIHVRAEPRLMRPDSDVNRRRIEDLHARFDGLHERYLRRIEQRRSEID